MTIPGKLAVYRKRLLSGACWLCNRSALRTLSRAQSQTLRGKLQHLSKGLPDRSPLRPLYHEPHEMRIFYEHLWKRNSTSRYQRRAATAVGCWLWRMPGFLPIQQRAWLEQRRGNSCTDKHCGKAASGKYSKRRWWIHQKWVGHQNLWPSLRKPDWNNSKVCEAISAQQSKNNGRMTGEAYAKK